MLPSFFFFHDTATTGIYTLSLHDALPISPGSGTRRKDQEGENEAEQVVERQLAQYAFVREERDREVRLTFREASADRKSTRLNSSHVSISYAVFCLKKKSKKSYSMTITVL